MTKEPHYIYIFLQKLHLWFCMNLCKLLVQQPKFFNMSHYSSPIGANFQQHTLNVVAMMVWNMIQKGEMLSLREKWKKKQRKCGKCDEGKFA